MKLRKDKVEIFSLVKTVCNGFEYELKEKEITCTLTGDMTIVFADSNRIYQVIANLLSNAIKYSNPHGRIMITVEDETKEGRFVIEDEGIGIPNEDLPFIFERFYRTDKSRSRETGGTGIGLTIVKAIVQAHGGIITVESGVGRGSRFIVTLPK